MQRETSEDVGLVALSFALCEHEPSPTNTRLADAAIRILQSSSVPIVVVSQWEITLGLKLRGFEPDLSVGLRPDGRFLGSEDVIAEAARFFRKRGVTTVIPVCQRGLHRMKVNDLLRREGFTLDNRPVGRIGFDANSKLWWTRGPVRLATYAVRQKVTGLHGHHGLQDPAERGRLLRSSNC